MIAWIVVRESSSIVFMYKQATFIRFSSEEECNLHCTYDTGMVICQYFTPPCNSTHLHLHKRCHIALKTGLDTESQVAQCGEGVVELMGKLGEEMRQR